MCLSITTFGTVNVNILSSFLYNIVQVSKYELSTISEKICLFSTYHRNELNIIFFSWPMAKLFLTLFAPAAVALAGKHDSSCQTWSRVRWHKRPQCLQCRWNRHESIHPRAQQEAAGLRSWSTCIWSRFANWRSRGSSYWWWTTSTFLSRGYTDCKWHTWAMQACVIMRCYISWWLQCQQCYPMHSSTWTTS